MGSECRRIIPFKNAIHYVDWQFLNCHRCAKFNYHDPQCKIDKALFDAARIDGSVTEKIAKKMGYVCGCEETVWRCPYFKELPQSAWKRIRFRYWRFDPDQITLF